MTGLPLETTLQKAQKRVAEACLKQPLHPSSVSISAYLNTTLLSCRVDALQELFLNPPNGTWTAEEALEAALVRHLTAKAEALESQALKAQLSTPGIVRPG